MCWILKVWGGLTSKGKYYFFLIGKNIEKFHEMKRSYFQTNR